MVMKELRGRQVELMKLFGNIRSATLAQVRKFPGAKPHRIHREGNPGYRSEQKKKMI